MFCLLVDQNLMFNSGLKIDGLHLSELYFFRLLIVVENL